MVPDDTKDVKFSIMSLAVAKDSGFYVIDMTKAEHFFWGKGEGCDMFKTTCPVATVDEFCSEISAHSCSDNHMYTASCRKSEFTGSCNINLNVSWCKNEKDSGSKYFTYGHDSVCLVRQVSYFMEITNKSN